MCGIFGQTDLEKILAGRKIPKTIHSKKISSSLFEDKLIVKPNQLATILTVNGILEAKFGFVKGERQNKSKIFWFNARVEFYNNKDNSVSYTGPFSLFKNPHLQPILSQRAIIPASHFFESPTGDKKTKYLIKPTNQIYLGGLWTAMADSDTGEQQTINFCILTTVANKATQSVNHQRSPVIIEEADIDNFLNPRLDFENLQQYFRPNNSASYESFKISNSQLQDGNLFSPTKLTDFEAIGPIQLIA